VKESLGRIAASGWLGYARKRPAVTGLQGRGVASIYQAKWVVRALPAATGYAEKRPDFCAGSMPSLVFAGL
jgi:hypothetical protein